MIKPLKISPISSFAQAVRALFIVLNLLYSPVINSFMIQDLHSNNASFINETQTWQRSTHNNLTFVTQCGDYWLLDGDQVLSGNNYFSKEYDNLPAHEIIYFSIRFMIIDSWDYEDSFKLYFDSIPFNFSDLSTWNSMKPLKNLCGSGFGDLFFTVHAQIPHISKKFQVKVAAATEGIIDEYLGFRELTILLGKVVNHPVSPSLCLNSTAPFPHLTLCQTFSCSPACKSCFGTTDSECYECQSDFIYEGNRCICKPGFSLLRDFGCVICAPPLVKTVQGECIFNCNSSQYLNPDGTCSDQCKHPFKNQVSKYNKMFCEYSCDTTRNEIFYFRNQTCLPSCDRPLVKKEFGPYFICEAACGDNDYYYYFNGSCRDECQPPFKFQHIDGIPVCYPPCGNSSQYYLELTHACQSYCEYPNQVSSRKGVNFCTLNITTEDLKKIEQLNSFSSLGGTTASVGGLLACLLSSGDPGALGVTSLVKMLQYIKLLDIKYPPKLYISLQSQKIVPTGPRFSPKVTAEIKNQFSKQSLPHKFESFELHSSLIVNLCELLITISIALSVILLVVLLKFSFRKVAKVRSILEKVVPALKWNFLLTIICSNSGDIGLYTAIELISLSLNDALSVLSFIICFGLNTILLCVIGVIVKITVSLLRVRKSSRENNRERKLKSFEKKWEGFTMLFQGFRSNSLLQQVYMLCFILRAYLTNIIVGFFSSYPLAQTITLTILSCSTLIYLCLKMPMVKTVNNIQQIFLEVTILLVNICVLALSIMDHQNIDDFYRRELLGDIVIGTSLAISLVSPLLLAVKGALAIRELYLARKAAKLEQERLKISKAFPQIQTRPMLSSLRFNRPLQLLRSSKISSNLKSDSEIDHTQNTMLNKTVESTY